MPRRRAPRLIVPALIGLLGAGSAAAVGDDGADGKFERRDSFHFTLHQDVDIDERGGIYGSRAFEQSVLDALEGAYDRLGALLGLRPESKLVVWVWDPDLFDDRFAGLFRFPAAGFYGGAIHVRGADRVTPRLVAVLHHELVHAALDAAAPRVVLPAWLNEGLAEWFEARAGGKRTLSPGERAAIERVARAGGIASLEALAGPSFAGLAPEPAAIAYLQSYAFIDHLARRFGEAELARFGTTVLRARSVDRGARKIYRRDLASLEADFRAEIGAP
ncbi:MAG: hypothetical protein H6748_05875 [Spirochaetaceae bacterium]|nr:hypothetical protein [Myxococcales bacterium]MCB9723554.1 hypothetical protein [Spirochaetaceae bacterium]